MTLCSMNVFLITFRGAHFKHWVTYTKQKEQQDAFNKKNIVKHFIFILFFFPPFYPGTQRTTSHLQTWASHKAVEINKITVQSCIKTSTKGQQWMVGIQLLMQSNALARSVKVTIQSCLQTHCNYIIKDLRDVCYPSKIQITFQAMFYFTPETNLTFLDELLYNLGYIR